ncbi:tRNA glutamyl-Q(34) synthetase GluQRS [Alteriqipengyuania lutimaris]|uniref:tRNA glutamyl-Q(34) synthetase GluQRS n=1 Tax=Alteriqipengyuania lutimaris TaxID=1538146 RepID=A0A395LI45_9SPHN|nr:tRNA glutamyl-Q(34) synthetase GluQRS [Alteriqipengyuania lutimaris]MBB3034577.1 glutamyl-Q tRNA(Asp) synthetase [Alteriqipengyuania lutimaris]RDS76542.1 tRNA glutamyl-Q(34) synthetase GluQRS [Alteriqipengyuania lutimaris]
MIVTRFAPSPNGPLHWGHAYSAIIAHDLAQEADGRFVLRIEDIDGPRSRPELADEFRRDLEWLGLEWEEVPAQGTRLETYRAAARHLLDEGLLYPCTCTRRQIEALEPRMGPDGAIYPGTCKGRLLDPAQPAALRLDLDRALARPGQDLSWHDALAGGQHADPREFGDVVLVRKDLPASYHLAATLDDAADGVTLVTRGQDLFHASHIHRLLQALLDLPVPRWHHHPLLLDENGRKLAKRRGSPAIADYRERGGDGRGWAEKLRTAQWPCGISLGNTHI